MTNLIFRNETSADYRQVENLTREAFWNVYRPGCTEHFVLNQFRDKSAFIPELSIIMELDGKIIGHVMYAHSCITSDNGEQIPIMTFGPLSIHPDYKGQGYGTRLLQYSISKAKEMGAKALAITGNIAFYGKCGFILGKNNGVLYADDPDADYFLVRELEVGFLDKISGTYKDPEEYFIDENQAETFDKSFPPKEKLKLPGQLF